MEYFSRDARNFDCSTLPFPAAWAAPIQGPVDVETAHFVKFCRGPVFDFEHVDIKRSMLLGFKMKLVILANLKM